MEKQIREAVDELAKRIFGRSLTEALKEGICVECGKKVKNFRHTLSAREYKISGLCEKCQDKVWESKKELKFEKGKTIKKGKL